MSDADVNRRGRSLALGAAILMAGFVASRALGLVRTMVISGRFGDSAEYQAYVAAIRIPDTLFQVLAGGAVAAAFIPVFAGYSARGETDNGWRLASSVITIAALVMTPVSLLLMLLAPQLMALLAPGWDEPRQQLAGSLARILLISPVIFAISTFVTSILNSFSRFLLASLAPVVYNLSIIFGALFLAEPLGIYGLAIGAAAGALLHLLVQLPGLFHLGMRFRPMLNLADEGVREVGRLMVPRALALGVVQASYLVNITLASELEEGSLAYLDYAWLLMMLPLGVFAMAISTAVFPTMAAHGALDRMDELRETFLSSLRLILYLTIPCSVGLLLLGEPIVRLLLERGSFTPEATRATAYALAFYALGLGGHATIEIVNRVFYALHDTKTPVIVAAGAFLLNVSASLVLMQYLSFGGLALGNALAGLTEAAFLVLLLGRRGLGIQFRSLVFPVVVFGVWAIAQGLVAAAVADYLRVVVDVSTLPGQMAQVLLSVGAGAAVYAGLSYAMRSRELMLVAGNLRARLGR